MVHRVTTSDNEWKPVRTSATMSDNEWQRVTTCDATSDSEWQQTVIQAVVQPMKTAQYTSKNGLLLSFQWQKQIHYYFKGWMAAIRVVK